MVGEAGKKAVQWWRVLPVVAWLVVLGGIAALIFPLFVPTKIADHFPPNARANFKHAGLALIMYSWDADDRLPPADTWMDAALPYIKNRLLFRATDVPGNDTKGNPMFGMAFRRSLAGVNLTKLERPDQVAMIFDSTDLRWNAAGELDLLPHPPRHEKNGHRTNVICFADWHARLIPSLGVVVK